MYNIFTKSNIEYDVFNISEINRCNYTIDGCHTNASCVNITGSYMCVCNQGFSGNGAMCTGMYFDLFSIW